MYKLVKTVFLFALLAILVTSGVFAKTNDVKTLASRMQSSACKNIKNACIKAGFVSRRWREGNGLGANCLFPLVSNYPTSPTRFGKPVAVAVSADDIRSCNSELNTRGEKAYNEHTESLTPACRAVANECKKAGFVQGQAVKGNGLWANCFDPLVSNYPTSPSRYGQPLSIAVNPDDIKACNKEFKPKR